MFDYIKALLNEIGDLFETLSKATSLMLKTIDETDINKKSVGVELVNKLLSNCDEYQIRLQNTIEDFGNQNISLLEDLNSIEEILSNFLLQFNDNVNKFDSI